MPFFIATTLSAGGVSFATRVLKWPSMTSTETPTLGGFGARGVGEKNRAATARTHKIAITRLTSIYVPIPAKRHFIFQWSNFRIAVATANIFLIIKAIALCSDALKISGRRGEGSF